MQSVLPLAAACFSYWFYCKAQRIIECRPAVSVDERLHAAALGRGGDLQSRASLLTFHMNQVTVINSSVTCSQVPVSSALSGATDCI